MSNLIAEKEDVIMEKKEAIRKEREVVEEIAKILKRTYPKTWNFEIDFVEGDITRNYTLRVKVYQR